jgi:hypothetical protein
VLAPGISRNSKNWREREKACVKGAQKFENSTGRLSGASSGSRCRHAAGSLVEGLVLAKVTWH